MYLYHIPKEYRELVRRKVAKVKYNKYRNTLLIYVETFPHYRVLYESPIITREELEEVSIITCEGVRIIEQDKQKIKRALSQIKFGKVGYGYDAWDGSAPCPIKILYLGDYGENYSSSSLLYLGYNKPMTLEYALRWKDLVDKLHKTVDAAVDETFDLERTYELSKMYGEWEYSLPCYTPLMEEIFNLISEVSKL